MMAATKRATRFSNLNDIQSVLHRQNSQSLLEGLSALRNHLTVKSNDTHISPQDERLILVKDWLGHDSGATELFSIWQNGTNQSSLLVVTISLFSSILTLLTSHYTNQVLGQPIIRTLLNPINMRRLHSYIGGSDNGLIIVTMKLFNTLSAYSGGKEKRNLLENFAWEIKSLPKLLKLRRKTNKNDEKSDILAKPDIRTLYILFILSFIDTSSTTQVKTTFLEQHRDVFLSIFKGLDQDPYNLLHKVLEVCWAGLWSDPKVRRTLKIPFFNEATIGHLLKLYDRATPEDDDQQHIPADLVHHFLLAICTRPGFGICFKDHGWYPRESDSELSITDKGGDEEVHGSKGGSRIHNRILSNILKTLKVNEDSRQQELALRVMSACPELVAGYWSGAALTLEPRLSSKWITNISFFGSIISLPVPEYSFLLPTSVLYQPTPPPLSTIIENILPSVNTKNHFSKGLQSTSALVQHCSAIALVKCLAKYESVIKAFRLVETTLEENEDDGQWLRRHHELEREIRKRIPDFQVIVAFSQLKIGPATSKDAPSGSINPLQATLLSESAQRLLLMYQRCLPSVVAEARFDVGKLLLNAMPKDQEHDTDDFVNDDTLRSMSSFNRIRELHVIKLLEGNQNFMWSGKAGSSSHSYLFILLKRYTTTEMSATRVAFGSLLQHVLARSVMFQEDEDEPSLWLACLPRTQRGHIVKTPDGVILSTEADSVIGFLDECVQRCLKTPYKYVEALQGTINLVTEAGFTGRLETYPSPLFMTILEQLEAKVGNKLLTPSETLALASFIRKLLFRLTSKVQDLQILRNIVEKLAEIFSIDSLSARYPMVKGAILREVGMMRHSLPPFVKKKSRISGNSMNEIREFLMKPEFDAVPESKSSSMSIAHQVVDWMRIEERSLGPAELERVIAIMKHLHPTALRDVVENMDPLNSTLWRALDVAPHLLSEFEFAYLYLHMGEDQILSLSSREALTSCLFTAANDVLPITNLRRAVRLITHNISGSSQDEKNRLVQEGHILLLASIMKSAISSNSLSLGDLEILKEDILVHPGKLKDAMMSESVDEVISRGFVVLIDTCLDPIKASDRKLASEISIHWLNLLKIGLRSNFARTELQGAIWIKYLHPSDLFTLLDEVTSKAQQTNLHNRFLLELATVVLSTIAASSTFESPFFESSLNTRLSQLLPLRSLLPGSAILEDLLSKAIEMSLPSCYDGRLSKVDTSALETMDIVSVVKRAETRWAQALSKASHPLNLNLEELLHQENLSESTINIICGLIYSRPFPASRFSSWLLSENCARQSNESLVRIFDAVLNISFCCSSGNDATIAVLASEARTTWGSYCPRVIDVLVDGNQTPEMRKTALSCVTLLSKLDSHLAVTVHENLQTKVESLPRTVFTVEILLAGQFLHRHTTFDAKPLVTALADKAIQWIIPHLGGGGEDESKNVTNIIEQLTALVVQTAVATAHLVETLASVVIQHRLSDIASLKLLSACLKVASLKPLIVNRLLQSVVQHSHFFKYCASPTRDAIIDLLYILFNLHPANTCQVTHIEPLIKVYNGTLAPSDTQILSIFQLFEKERKTSVSSLISRWSTSYNALSSTHLEALHSLDPTLVLRTLSNFPKWRRLQGQVIYNKPALSQDTLLYDPVFVLLLFGQMLFKCPPATAFSWVELFRTNVVSLLIRALSSGDGDVREVALSQIAALWKQLDSADFHERQNVSYILKILKDTLPAPSDDSPKQLPSFTTLILAHALRGIFYPSNFIYPLTSRFLLQRPELDVTDVPMLYGMLYSNSDDWKKERGWIIRFLSDGLMSTEDWRIFKRRHTWELLASLFQSSDKDHTLQRGILEVLAKLIINSQLAVTTLILKNGLLAWIEMQLIRSKSYSMEWVRILESILITVDPGKIEISTAGEWRSTICRCLLLLLDDNNPQLLVEFPLAVPVILRLSLLPGKSASGLSDLLDRCITCLRRLEADTRELSIWGNSVENLWRAAMTLEERCNAWGLLTSRLLVWRAAMGSEVGEWCRKEVVDMHVRVKDR